MPRGRVVFVPATAPGVGATSDALEAPPTLDVEWTGTRFADRADAGRRLAERLAAYRAERPVVLGLARGGVPVAAEVAGALGAPMDVLVVRKLGVPWHEELGFGAIAEGGVTVIDQGAVAVLGIGRDAIERVVGAEQDELERRVHAYRGSRRGPSVEGRTVIVVDDGIATGGTMRAAVAAVRAMGARRVVVAVPVSPAPTVGVFRALVDDVVVVEAAEPFFAVGQFYEAFPQMSDEDVTATLSEHQGSNGGAPGSEHEVDMDLGAVALRGDLVVPPGSSAIVVFAHGSGSSRLSSRNRSVAATLNDAGIGTLLFDLLTFEEERDRVNVFDLDLLTDRLTRTTDWLGRQAEAAGLGVGYFGASTGAAAALAAAADLGRGIDAVVSRGGRPDLAIDRLPAVVSPTLLIVGEQDRDVLALNRVAATHLRCPHRLEIVPGATHLFEESGAMQRVATLAVDWFLRHLPT